MQWEMTKYVGLCQSHRRPEWSAWIWSQPDSDLPGTVIWAVNQQVDFSLTVRSKCGLTHYVTMLVSVKKKLYIRIYTHVCMVCMYTHIYIHSLTKQKKIDSIIFHVCPFAGHSSKTRKSSY